jgi:hypothetical protein
MSNTDEELRAIARAIDEGEPGAEERYIVAHRRRTTFEAALRAFVERLNEAARAHNKISFPDVTCFDRDGFVVDPRSRANVVKFVRVCRARDGRIDSVYCFVEKETGTILKPGGFKGPEPKRIPRGSIYNCEPLAGCGPHGVAYVAKGTRHSNYGWAPGVLGTGPTRIAAGPSLPVAEKG